ncbi:hypothetical protein ACFZBU_31960 [Embleya sp. NPDC008237]|uniref:hypothetical protein n=1 Tax=Embleya sp. NPDC008237 TaxID=3363978 RepID=UPI0036E94349
MQDSATVVPPYLMTPEELTARRRQRVEAETREGREQAERRAALAHAATRPAHDRTVAARAAGVMA